MAIGQYDIAVIADAISRCYAVIAAGALSNISELEYDNAVIEIAAGGSFSFRGTGRAQCVRALARLSLLADCMHMLMSMNANVTVVACSAERVIAARFAGQERYTVFSFDRVARDFSNDLVEARMLAAHYRGYVKDVDGRIYAARVR